MTPEELNKWLEENSDLYYENFPFLSHSEVLLEKQSFKKGATSMYQHLSGQKDKEIESLKTIIVSANELLDDVFHERFPASEIARKIIVFKTENNL